jgi:glycosyltransferase involved in cell wall biosynthesis
MNVLFALPGFHRVHRGAEVALETVATELARIPGFDVTLIGSGEPTSGTPYHFVHSGCIPRERFEHLPRFPPMRSEFIYEELTWVPGLLRRFKARDFDVTLTCSYPFTNWGLRAKSIRSHTRHVFVTENGDWPAYSNRREYRLFKCDGLICTSPEFVEHNSEKWNCALIPNGVDVDRFKPGPGSRATFDLPADGPIVLMVSALASNKRVVEGMQASAGVAGVGFVVAGDGLMRDEIDRLGSDLFGDRYRRVSVSHDEMPDLYRCADVFLHMSMIESFGNVYLEALATGLPIVAHDRDLTRWILGDQRGLVDTEQSKLVTGAIQAALRTDRKASDRDARPAVRAEFTWPNVAQQYATFLTGVVAAQR